jgi:hypothetical protein
VIFIAAGFVLGDQQSISFAPQRPATFASIASAPFAISLVFVMYSYSGWNAATYIAGELRDAGPQPAAGAACRHRDRARALCPAQRGIPAPPRRCRNWPARSTSPRSPAGTYSAR